jgi:hypothetical protein
MVHRGVNLLRFPRFLAEEGSAFFAYAYDHGFLGTLTYVYPKATYLSFITNFATGLAASTTSLEYAPFVTTYVALLVQLVPLAILAFGSSELLLTWRQKLVAGALVSLAPTASAGIWMTSLHSQVFLGLSAFLILFERLEEVPRLRGWAYRAILLVGGLSGVYTVIFQPLFLIRAVLQRGREQWVQAALVTVLLIVQVAIVITQERIHPQRAAVADVGVAQLVQTISIAQVGSAFVGLDAATWWEEKLGALGAYSFLAVFLLSVPVALVDWRRRCVRMRDARLRVVLCFLVVATVTAFLSLHGRPGGRYAVLPGYTILLYVISGAQVTRGRWLSALLASLLLVSMVSGMREYRDPTHFGCDGRDWRAEVDSWRKEPARAGLYRREASKELQICPSYWRMELEQPREGSGKEGGGAAPEEPGESHR